MSSDQDPQPLTRAEMRRLREAGEVARADEVAESESTAEPEAVADPKPVSEPEKVSAQDSEPPRRGRFVVGLMSVVVVLALAAVGLAAFSFTQGPRLSSVISDPAEAIELSGSRVILVANQPLASIDAAQVTVTPEVPFTLDAVGRSVGIRFTVPLDDNTEYTVSVADVRGIGGGPAATLTTTFITPGVELFVLQRSSDDDKIFRTNLVDESATVVFTHPRISSFRHLDDLLVVAVEQDSADRILVVNLQGEVVRELELPGVGYVQDLQVSDRGGIAGYVYSDRDFSDLNGLGSVLVMQSIASGEPVVVTGASGIPNIAEWQFVPDTSSALFIDFQSTLYVIDGNTPDAPTPLGTVFSILGIERGTYTAIIMDAEGNIVRRDLADGSESAIVPTRPDFGQPAALAPFPGGTVQHIVARDEFGMPEGQLVVRVDDDGAATALFEIGEGDAIMQACASPSGQYLAVTIAPNLISNPYDDMILAMPMRTETHLLNMDTGDPIVVLAGFNVSWCNLNSRM
jgi:hypothetical protein